LICPFSSFSISSILRRKLLLYLWSIFCPILSISVTVILGQDDWTTAVVHTLVSASGLDFLHSHI
jgi:hypothetical protein